MYKWNMQRRIKAQSSVEFLLLLVLSLAIITVFFSSYSSLSEASSLISSRAMFLKESSFFYELSKDLCISGDGNIREVNFPYEFYVKYYKPENKVLLNSTSGNMSYFLSCEVEDALVQGKVKMINKKGKIVIEH